MPRIDVDHWRMDVAHRNLTNFNGATFEMLKETRAHRTFRGLFGKGVFGSKSLGFELNPKNF